MKQIQWLWVVTVFALWVAACAPGSEAGPGLRVSPSPAGRELQGTQLVPATEPPAGEAGGEQNPSYRIPPSPTLKARADQEPLPAPIQITPGVPPKQQALFEQARADLSARLGIDPQAIEFVRMLTEPGEPVCPLIKATPLPQPVIRNRTTITLKAGDKQYIYLVEGIYVRLCDMK